MKRSRTELRSNDWARDFLNEAAENAHAPRADIPDSTKKIPPSTKYTPDNSPKKTVKVWMKTVKTIKNIIYSYFVTFMGKLNFAENGSKGSQTP